MYEDRSQTGARREGIAADAYDTFGYEDRSQVGARREGIGADADDGIMNPFINNFFRNNYIT